MIFISYSTYEEIKKYIISIKLYEGIVIKYNNRLYKCQNFFI